MNDPSSPGSGIQRGWTTDARTSMCWIEHTLEYYAEINTTKNKFGIGISCALRFKSVLEIIHCCLTSKGYNGYGPEDLTFLYDAKILRVIDFFSKHTINP